MNEVLLFEDKNSAPFSDALEIDEILLHAAFELWDVKDITIQEESFLRVLFFHLDFLNGGFGQVMNNRRDSLEKDCNAYRTLGLDPLALVIELALNSHRNFFKKHVFKSSDLKSYEAIYVAIAYDLSYACSKFSSSLNADDEMSDWVQRMALKFARENRTHFPNIISAWEQEVKQSSLN